MPTAARKLRRGCTQSASAPTTCGRGPAATRASPTSSSRIWRLSVTDGASTDAQSTQQSTPQSSQPPVELHPEYRTRALEEALVERGWLTPGSLDARVRRAAG